MQIVGRPPLAPCSSCRKGNGPWAKFLTFPLFGGQPSACGNCHWGGEDKRYDFYREPVADDDAVSRGHRRTSSMQERVDKAVLED
ncbi:hypothetical protein N7509_012639 [Penicillium cosmopolitanum]|uniref:Uncharacterized protein n=1 Tax=Penicillium cosmopolitanum TaxID=1131564 RepID=A0A9W9SJE5_9EURO|nr:uncharacterized protein N7509_012639 [Penicillium cosmopolitanum]KAJ5379520.1 hypothetical protein N7509_012639 [Penicillium cosmopolitanum]